LRNHNETIYFLLSPCCLMVMCKICTVLLHVAFLHAVVGRWARAIGTCDKLSELHTINAWLKRPLHVPFSRDLSTMTKNTGKENCILICLMRTFRLGMERKIRIAISCRFLWWLYLVRMHIKHTMVAYTTWYYIGLHIHTLLLLLRWYFWGTEYKLLFC